MKRLFKRPEQEGRKAGLLAKRYFSYSVLRRKLRTLITNITGLDLLQDKSIAFRALKPRGPIRNGQVT